jgi:ubiquinone biosynthesis UbiH/UbiF/VisC/COQ6 family hydroxylase
MEVLSVGGSAASAHKRGAATGLKEPYFTGQGAGTLPTIPAMMQADVLVRGGGVVGHSLALALARQGLKVALAAAPRVPPDLSLCARPPEGVEKTWERPGVFSSSSSAASVDVRAYALNAASRHLLQTLKVWDALPPSAVTPVLEMRIAGDAQGAALTFSAWQQAVQALAWIVDVPALEQALQTAVRFAQHITVVDESADAVQAPLTALCEGKASSSRARLGIAVTRHAYGHQAIAARLVCQHPHNGVAHQWFGNPEVLALLPVDAPLAGRTVALVWSVPDARAAELRALPQADFERALGYASQGVLGRLELVSPRAAWPLLRSQAHTWCGPGWVLVGDAAHASHPLAGQGLNLGLADVACLARVLSERESWRGLGDEKLLRRYPRARAVPTGVMDQGVDALWQLFAADNPWMKTARNLGLATIEQLPFFKRQLVRRAFGTQEY